MKLAAIEAATSKRRIEGNAHVLGLLLSLFLHNQLVVEQVDECDHNYVTAYVHEEIDEVTDSVIDYVVLKHERLGNDLANIDQLAGCPNLLD